ncbi:MAG: ABC transporter permease [Candidatus Aquicultor sp.]|nr:ABC transporter permease [Candidatus Aquicultor sp.]
MALSTGGIALAILVILLIEGVFAGVEEQATAYIDKGKADLFVMQEGVANLHMASSFLPPAIENGINDIEGVKKAVGITYSNTTAEIGGNRIFSYVIGFDPQETIGGPWKKVKGTQDISPDEVVLDKIIAAQNGVGLGDEIKVMGRSFKIAGLSQDTFSIVSSITFLRKATVAELNQRPNSINYVLVETEAGSDPRSVARRIEKRFKVNAMTQEEFSQSDRLMIRKMGIDIILAMSFISLVIGLAVIGMTLYTATLDRFRDYGVLKAVGASRFQLYTTVAVQSLVTALLGFVAGLLLAYLSKFAVTAIFPELLIVLPIRAVIEAFVAILIISVLATIIPVRLIEAVDPMVVFEGA